MTTVTTTSGDVRGMRRDGVAVFAGIPYAAPPVGPLRFRAPRPPEPWTGVRDVLEFGLAAMQQEFRTAEGKDWLAGYRRSEDSLILNVWTPEPDGNRRPVMVWIHGGGFSAGVGREVVTDGAVLAAEQDVVVVSLNHRLGVFGALRLSAVDRDAYPDTGNVGILDIVAALAWVRDNIGRFGGDPSNVTVFGHSGGGWKISTLLAMPAARGLFHKAIIQSGSYLRATSQSEAEDGSRRLIEALGLTRDDLERIQDIPAQQIFDAAQVDAPMTSRFHSDGSWTWGGAFSPSIDGETLTREPFVPDAPPGSAAIPLLIGMTKDEFATAAPPVSPAPETFEEVAAWATERHLPDAAAVVAVLRQRRPAATPTDIMNDLIGIPLFFIAGVRQLEAELAAGNTAVYAYLFDWSPRHLDGLSPHGADQPFIFGTLSEELTGQPVDDEMRALSAGMRAAWGAFARTGDPGHDGLPSWPGYDLATRSTMMFGAESRVESDPESAVRRILTP